MRVVQPLVLATLLAPSWASSGASSFLGHLRAKHRGAADGGTVTTDGTSATTSLAEVIELLGTMLKEFNEADKQDKENWADYSEWSDEAETDKLAFIQKQKALVMSLTSKMNANKQLVQKLTADLKKLADDIKDSRDSIKDLVQMRKEEHTTFEASLADVTKTITAVGKATEILEGHYAAGGAALAEIRRRVQLALTMYSGVRKSKKDVDTLASLLQDGRRAPDYLSIDGDKYNTYEKQGGAGGVLGMLDDLRSQLEGQKQELIANEADAQRQFDETKAAKTSELKGFLAQQDEKTQKRENAKATISTCETGISEATVAISDGQKYLTELLADREKFSKQKDSRVQMRAEELAATQAALDALQAVSAGATATVEGGAASFLQVSTMTPAKATRLQKTLRKLLPLGKQLKSVALVQTVTKSLQDFDAGSSFAPVVKLLNDLITRLETEASAETSQHEWCENEKEASVKARDEREAAIKTLKSTIESVTTMVAQLKTEIVFMESEIKRVNSETKTAIKIRKEEKELFTSSKADHEEVITAIKAALQALGGQYGFLQIQAQRTVVVKRDASNHRVAGRRAHGKDSPFSDYASGDASAASATEMLEDLEGRYETALSNLIKDENESQKQHDILLATNKQFVEATTAEKNAKLKERRAALQDLADDKDDMKTNLLELHEVSKYLMDLRPSCDDIRSTYEERKKRREAEIAALKEALEVISDPSAMGF